jgi:hypothetical protein
LHRLGKGFQEWEEKRAEAKIAHRIVQIPLMEWLCCTLSDSRVMDETYLSKDPLCEPTDICSFLNGQQRFTKNAPEPMEFQNLHLWLLLLIFIHQSFTLHMDPSLLSGMFRLSLSDFSFRNDEMRLFAEAGVNTT